MFVTGARLLQQQCAMDAYRIDVPLNVPFCTGCQWISLDVTGSRKGTNHNRISDLQRSLDFVGSPWKVEVERAPKLHCRFDVMRNVKRSKDPAQKRVTSQRNTLEGGHS